MLPHPLTSFEIQSYFQNEPKFNVYSRNSLPNTKDAAYVINVVDYKSIGTHYITLEFNCYNGSASDDATYLDHLAVEHIPKKIEKFKWNKNIITNIYRMQAYHLIMCGYFCIGLFDFTIKGKRFLDYTKVCLIKVCFIPGNYRGFKNLKVS